MIRSERDRATSKQYLRRWESALQALLLNVGAWGRQTNARKDLLASDRQIQIVILKLTNLRALLQVV